MKNSEEYWIAYVKKNPIKILNAPEHLRKNKKVALAAVEKDGLVFCYLDSSLKEDYDIVLAAIQSKPFILAKLSEELRNDYNIVMKACSKNGFSIMYANDRFKDDYAIAKIVMKTSPFLFCELSYRLRCDVDIFLEACVDVNNSYQYTSQEIKDDHDLACKAVSKASTSYYYFSDRLKSSYDVIFCLFLHLFKIFEKKWLGRIVSSDTFNHIIQKFDHYFSFLFSNMKLGYYLKDFKKSGDTRGIIPYLKARKTNNLNYLEIVNPDLVFIYNKNNKRKYDY